MGMFDSYIVSQNFKCPNCGLEYNKEADFQTKELINCLDVYTLGGFIDTSRRFVDFYSYCNNRYNRSNFDKPKDKNGKYPIIPASCKNGEFNCRVFLNEEGKAIKERVTMYDKEKNKEILIYEKGGLK